MIVSPKFYDLPVTFVARALAAQQDRRACEAPEEIARRAAPQGYAQGQARKVYSGVKGLQAPYTRGVQRGARTRPPSAHAGGGGMKSYDRTYITKQIGLCELSRKSCTG